MKMNLPHSLSENYRKKFPNFLLDKMDDFYVNRLHKEWNGKHILRGAIPSENSINLSSNDYLHLFRDFEILNSETQRFDETPGTPLMSASFIHGDAPQAVLEKRMASFFESESALLCQSGYVANLGLLQALVEDTEVPVYIDMMAHMSLWNGIRLGNGKAIPFLHNDINYLKRKIEEHGAGIIVVDSVYSSDGSVAPLSDIAEIARTKYCTLVVDESHSLGTHGPDGKGLVVELGITDVVLFRTASLAKAFASRAGLILCPEEFGDFFNVTSKPQIFSSALMPFDIKSLNTVLDLINSDTGNERRLKLDYNSKQLKSFLQEKGIDVNESQSQIIALKANSESKIMLLKEILENEQVFGAPFCTPATSKKRPVLRFSLHSELQLHQLEYVAAACEKAFSVLKI
ncbi:alpha-hydroxyketone-type quorum-sensing autoinducer synthase [Chryseobacterium sp. 2R14A]|uniref:alpha-hydroxyketone-type quorum-sensing autoinducer synthase n=1 Tax=Chryseobacterium sp. 2R14A TaxID=3380353 RepID=UPI003CF5F301